MTESARRPSPTRRPAARPSAALAADPGPVPASLPVPELATADSGSGTANPSPPSCNVPRCPRTPEWRGLCSSHRQTHRGLADPKGAR